MKIDSPDFSRLPPESFDRWAIPNTDEAAVLPVTLPDVLALDTAQSCTAEDWKGARRRQVLQLFAESVYGQMFPKLPFESVIVEESGDALAGRATRKQVALRLSKNGKAVCLKVILYHPNRATEPAPCFLGLNFSGNHASFHDPAVLLSDAWMPAKEGVEDHRATEAMRGGEATRWPVEKMIERGYALATLYYGDIDPDYHDGFQNGLHGLFPIEASERADDAPGSITAWAWGLSRVLDYLQTLPGIDPRRVALTGHSRLGKAALWAAANDERFALAIINNSGCGGTALSRRNFGETALLISKRFPHWFCKRFWSYAGDPETFPLDQHWLVSLVAPRPIMVSSAADDLWADPKGEFLGAFHASPVYHLLGAEGMNGESMPPVGQPIYSRIGYSIRDGKHDITPEDWEVHLRFADRHMTADR